MATELAQLTAAEQALANVETPQEAKDLYDRLEALAQYAMRYRLEHEQQNEIARLKLTTARKGGELLAVTVHAGNPQLSRDGTIGTLPEGFTRNMSARWQGLARLPEAEWLRFLGSNTELTLKAACRLSREFALREDREAREAEARATLTGEPDLVVADVRAWRPTDVHAIITDPPYIGDALPLYEALRDFAADVLPPGGALVVMTWQAILPDVIDALRHDELAYRWTIAWRYANAENTVDHARRVFDCWKPILVYHRGAMPADAAMLRDEITNDAPDKDHHAWGQSLGGFQRLVETFSRPGELVCDPFLGGGTTAIAALAAARRFIGADVDTAAVATTRERLACA